MRAFPFRRFPMGTEFEMDVGPIKLLFTVSPDIVPGAELVEQSILGLTKVASNDEETLRLMLNTLMAHADFIRGRLEGYPDPGGK